MDKEDKETMKHMSKTLDGILVVLSKTPNRLTRVFEIAATGITLLGVLSIIDIIINWMRG